MKLLISTLLFIPTLTFASTALDQQNEKQAILASPEIAALLKVETKMRNLVCVKETLQDVTLTADEDEDDFAVIYTCSGTDGKGVTRFHFTGWAYDVEGKPT